ncbi:MAG TPA: twin-arginine translocase subunit TatC [Anaerolineaceae bacterium]|nr:twin-arginine translocase subunit TatC [Anaerolineaceae bacterium]
MTTSRDVPAEFWDHLKELRTRLVWSFLALILGSVAGFLVAEPIMRILSQPIGGLEFLVAIEITESFVEYMRVALLTGFILALPVIVWQVGGWFTLALEPREKRWLYISIPAATVLFLLGAAFTFFVMLPAAVPFLTGFIAEIKTTPRLSNYIAFVTNLMFWVGLAFETPLLAFILAKLRLLTAGALAKQWRIAIVIIAILAAFITPTGDPFNMMLLMAPLLVLYLVSIGLALLAGERKPRAPKKAKPARGEKKLRKKQKEK